MRHTFNTTNKCNNTLSSSLGVADNCNNTHSSRPGVAGVDTDNKPEGALEADTHQRLPSDHPV